MAAQRPPYLQMVKEAIIAESSPAKGLSRQAIKKYLQGKHGLDVESKLVKNRIAGAIKKGCEANELATPDGLSGKIKFVTKPKTKSGSRTAAKAPTKKDASKKIGPSKTSLGSSKAKDMDDESDEEQDEEEDDDDEGESPETDLESDSDSDEKVMPAKKAKATKASTASASASKASTKNSTTKPKKGSSTSASGKAKAKATSIEATKGSGRKKAAKKT